MSVPQLNRQLQTQLSQWIYPQDQRHLQGFCENVAAILQAQSACPSHWLPYLSHRDCQARSHMERINHPAASGRGITVQSEPIRTPQGAGN